MEISKVASLYLNGKSVAELFVNGKRCWSSFDPFDDNNALIMEYSNTVSAGLYFANPYISGRDVSVDWGD